MSSVSAKAIKSALICTAKRDIRYYLEGVYVEKRGDFVTVVGTNGHLLFVCREKVDASEDDFEVIIPNQAASAGVKTAEGLFVDVAPKHEGIWAIGGQLFRPIEGKYPEYKKVIPRNPLTGEISHFDPEKLVKAFKAVSSYSGTIPALQMNGTGPGVYASSSPDCLALVMPLSPEHLDVSPSIRPFQEWALEGYVGTEAEVAA